MSNVPVTWAQLLFLVEGYPTALPAHLRRNAPREPADPVAVPIADLETLSATWANAFGGDRLPGLDCGIPAWTSELAALAARRRGTVEALTRHAMAVTDYLAFGRAVPLRQLTADIVAANDSSHGDAGRSVPDPEVTRLAADLQRARATHEAAEAAYRDAVWQAVAAAAPQSPPTASWPTPGGDTDRDRSRSTH